MCAGGVLAYLVLIPAIKFFGEGVTTALPPGTVPIAEMGPDEIRGAYILYIGAGAVAAGGIISLFRSLPTIWHGLKGGLSDLAWRAGSAAQAPRTDQDLSMKFVVGGILVLIAMIMMLPQLHLQFNLLGAILIIAFGFLFVTVSSRLTGEIGSSSNPISGMTVATLLLTCLIFLIVGWTGPSLLRHRAFDRRHRLYRCVERRHDFAGFEDRFSGRRHAEVSADRDSRRRACFGADSWTNPAPPERPEHGLRAADNVQAGCKMLLRLIALLWQRLPAYTETAKPAAAATSGY